MWEQTLGRMVTHIEGFTIGWEPHGDSLLLPAKSELVKELLTNKGYQQLTLLATQVAAMVKLARANRGLIEDALVSRGNDTAQAAMRCVSVTLTLFHLKVAWPKVKGQKHQTWSPTSL